MKRIGDMKVCSKCRKELHINHFLHNRAMPDGFDGYCRECGKENHHKQHLKGAAKLYKAGKLPPFMYS